MPIRILILIGSPFYTANITSTYRNKSIAKLLISENRVKGIKVKNLKSGSSQAPKLAVKIMILICLIISKKILLSSMFKKNT
jgi:hypothetical protein